MFNHSVITAGENTSYNKHNKYNLWWPLVKSLVCKSFSRGSIPPVVQGLLLFVFLLFLFSSWWFTLSVFALDLPAASQTYRTHFHIFPSKSMLQSLAIHLSFSRLFLQSELRGSWLQVLNSVQSKVISPPLTTFPLSKLRSSYSIPLFLRRRVSMNTATTMHASSKKLARKQPKCGTK